MMNIGKVILIERIDKRQRGVDKNGNVLYTFPTWISTTCDDRNDSGIAGVDSLNGFNFLVICANSMNGTQIGNQGIVPCPQQLRRS